MTERFGAASADSFVMRPIDGLTLIYHRPSGTTHIIGPDSLAILGVLHGAALTLGEIVTRLEALHELQPSEGATVADSIKARLDELATMDLVDRLP